MGPGISKVVGHVLGEISSGALSEGRFLPSRSVLARRFDVSTNTVALAVAHLKREGVLDGVSGQRAFVARKRREEVAEVTAVSSANSWDNVVERIKHDIMTGVHRGGMSLPSVKELQARYDSSYHTVRKALRFLTSERLLEQRGRKLGVPSVAAPSGSGHILFLWYTEESALPVHDTDTSFIRALEGACFRNSVTLEKLLVASRKKGRVTFMHHEDRARFDRRLIDDCMGVVYLVNWYGGVNSAVFDWLAHCGKPVSIVDWLGGWEIPNALTNRDTVQVIRSSVTSRPGFDAARYLIGLGHRQLAYFSPFALAWPAVRLEGIAEACALAGGGCRVHSFVQEKITDQAEYQDWTHRRYESVAQTFQSPPDMPPDYESGVELLSRNSWMAYENANYYEVLKPFFEEALSNKEITAWVGCNDAVAMMAWSFVRSRKVSIPEDISLLGFDNTLEAVVTDVTSYDSDYGAASGAVLNFLLRPTLARRIRELARPDIRGHIIQRGSTRPVRKSRKR